MIFYVPRIALLEFGLLWPVIMIKLNKSSLLNRGEPIITLLVSVDWMIRIEAVLVGIHHGVRIIFPLVPDKEHAKLRLKIQLGTNFPVSKFMFIFSSWMTAKHCNRSFFKSLILFHAILSRAYTDCFCDRYYYHTN